MNIFYISHRIPYPPNKGDKVRSFHQVEHLSKNHRLHLACMVDEREDLQHVRTLEKLCASVDAVHRDKRASNILSLFGFFKNKPLSVTSFYSKNLAQKINHRLNTEKFDRILVFSSAMAEYVKHIHHIPKIMDFVDVDSDKWRLYADYHTFPLSWIYRLEAKRLAKYEEEVARTFDHSIFVTEKEAELFKRRVDNRPISVIPNGVDLDYFSPSFSGSSITHLQENDPHSTLNTQHSALSILHPSPSTLYPIIIFTGAMDYFPNVDAVLYFCKEIFPYVRQEIPKAQFIIVGRNPTRAVMQLSTLQNVFVTGSVNDIRPFLVKAKVAVAPFRISRGIPNKILEAMAVGLPVVGTSVSFQGTKAKETDGVRVADDPNTFAKEILTLLENSDLRRQCSLNARSYVERFHRWGNHCALLESLLQEMS